MIKQIFDTKQDEVTLSKTGRVLICVNETELQVVEQRAVESDDASAELSYEDVTVTKYQYDTLWVKPVKQSDAEILKAFKRARVAEIDEYDTSGDVNSFSLNGVTLWLDRDTRGSLKNRLEAENAAGKTSSTIWYEGYSFALPIEYSLDLLNALEVYASECYDVTAQHKVDVEACDTIAEVGACDITTGYPGNPAFTISE